MIDVKTKRPTEHNTIAGRHGNGKHRFPLTVFTNSSKLLNFEPSLISLTSNLSLQFMRWIVQFSIHSYIFIYFFFQQTINYLVVGILGIYVESCKASQTDLS